MKTKPALRPPAVSLSNQSPGPLLPAALLALLLATSGCATHVTASGGRETTLLAGAMTVSTASFQPTTPATLDVDTSKLLSAGNPTGKKITLLWGLITLHDY